VQKEKATYRVGFFKRVKSALTRKNKNFFLISPVTDEQLSFVISGFEAEYRDGRPMPEKEAARLAKSTLCLTTGREQVMQNANTDGAIIRALLKVHKETKGSGAATVAAAKAAMQAAKTHMPTKHIEETLKSIYLIAGYTKSIETTVACAETISLYEGEHAVDVAGMLFNIILPYNYGYKESPKEVVMRSAAFLRDEEIVGLMRLAKDPFLLEIASYACSKPALEKCIKFSKFFIPLPGIPPYVQLGISKVARATRSGDEVIRWIGLMKSHLAKGEVNAKLMILLLCQFGIQAGDSVPNNLYHRDIPNAAESGKKILGESHKTFFAEFADCVL
jgi:hypothetical protein